MFFRLTKLVKSVGCKRSGTPHSCVVASIGDLKLLARLGVLVLKSCRPKNMTLSLVKLGLIAPSWEEPSLSEDLKVADIRRMSSRQEGGDKEWLMKWLGYYLSYTGLWSW